MEWAAPSCSVVLTASPVAVKIDAIDGFRTSFSVSISPFPPPLSPQIKQKLDRPHRTTNRSRLCRAVLLEAAKKLCPGVPTATIPDVRQRRWRRQHPPPRAFSPNTAPATCGKERKNNPSALFMVCSAAGKKNTRWIFCGLCCHRGRAFAPTKGSRRWLCSPAAHVEPRGVGRGAAAVGTRASNVCRIYPVLGGGGMGADEKRAAILSGGGRTGD